MGKRLGTVFAPMRHKQIKMSAANRGKSRYVLASGSTGIRVYNPSVTSDLSTDCGLTYKYRPLYAVTADQSA